MAEAVQKTEEGVEKGTAIRPGRPERAEDVVFAIVRKPAGRVLVTVRVAVAVAVVVVAVVMGGMGSPAAVAAAAAVAVVVVAGVAVTAAAGLVVEAAVAAVGAVSAVAEVAPAAAAAAAGIEKKVVVDSQGLDVVAVVASAAVVLAPPTALTLDLAAPFQNVSSQAPFPADPFEAREAHF